MDSPSFELPELLASIHSPEDVKALDARLLPQLAEEVRDTLIHTLSKTGGHLAPNLGVVELSIALHRVFNTPKDKILFDVSHQCYVHKMLTGRVERMDTIRQFQGISGFCKREDPSMMRTEPATPARRFLPVSAWRRRAIWRGRTTT